MDSSVPRFTTCSVERCRRPGVRGSSCAICKRHLCAQHLASSHDCNEELDDDAWANQINQEVSSLLAQVCVDELVKRASSLRSGIECRFQPGQHIGLGAIMGCANYHGWIEFADGQRWLVRIPRTGLGDVPDQLVDYLLASEYATLEFLRTTNVPAPMPFGYGLRSDPQNRVGVSYLLMEPLPGEPYSPVDATPEQKSRCFDQLAEILIEISKHPVSEIGSLIINHHQPEIAPVASNRFVALGTYGPFATAQDYFASIIDQHLDLISDGQLHHEHPRDAFLYYITLRQNISKLCKESGEASTPFYLKHVDDKGDHLLVDPDGNITGIIDWQFARCVPASEAFGPSYFTADLDTLYSARSRITEDDKLLASMLEKRGAPDIAYHMQANEMMRRLHHGLGGVGMMEEEICDLIKGTLVAFGIASEPEDVDLKAWREQTADLCREDPRWKQLVAHGAAVAQKHSGDS